MEKQLNNLNEEQNELIRGVFKNNDYLLQLIRALFYGLETTDEEKMLIKTTFSDKRLRDIFWRKFCPEIRRDTPVGQIEDVWLGAESMVFGQTESTIYQAIQYKSLSIEMTIKALGLLENPYGETIYIKYTPNYDDKFGVSLLARNQFIKHIDFQLFSIKIIAQSEPENQKKIAERKKINSAR